MDETTYIKQLEDERSEVANVLEGLLALIDLTGDESEAMDDVADTVNALMLRLRTPLK